MNPRHLIVVLAFSVLPILPMPAQENRPDPAPVEKGIPRSQVVVRYYKLHRDEGVPILLGAASQAFGRVLLIEDKPSPAQNTRNLFQVGNSIGILETPERAEEILKALPALEEACFGTASAESAKIELRHYALKHVNVTSLRDILAGFQRQVPSVAGDGSSGMNIAMLPERNVIILRDTAETHAAFENVLRAVDIPAMEGPSAAFTLTCLVLQATTEAPAGGQALPKELTDNLRRLGPWTQFELLGTAIVRAGADGDGAAAVTMDIGPGLACTLDFDGMKADPGKSIRLGQVRMAIQNFARTPDGPPATPTQIKTATVISRDEYTVIGAAGRTPYLLVLRASAQ